jgi:hypothetical protein
MALIKQERKKKNEPTNRQNINQRIRKPESDRRQAVLHKVEERRAVRYDGTRMIRRKTVADRRHAVLSAECCTQLIGDRSSEMRTCWHTINTPRARQSECNDRDATPNQK